MRVAIAAAALVGFVSAAYSTGSFLEPQQEYDYQEVPTKGKYSHDYEVEDPPVRAKTSTIHKVVTITSCAPGVKNCQSQSRTTTPAVASVTPTSGRNTTRVIKTVSATATATGKSKSPSHGGYDPYDAGVVPSKATSKPNPGDSSSAHGSSPLQSAACGTMQVIEVPVVYTSYSRSTVHGPCPTTTPNPHGGPTPRPTHNANATHTKSAVATPTVVVAGASLAKAGSTLLLAVAAMGFLL